ncbi:MAG: glycosyltransferase family 4 protein [Spirosomaceae bacterium]|jgi:glycosyltransferase involved in cell wall biosynthesis|nr:glycosyltransferase family 4 protein [Spirosomataceae bacterium]
MKSIIHSKKILFVSHDANRAGAQLMLLNFVQYFHARGMQNSILLLDGGVLEDDFKKVAKVFRFPRKKVSSFSLRERIKRKFNWNKDNTHETFVEGLKKEGFSIIYANTIASSSAINELLFLQLPIVTHIHELEFSIQMYSSEADRKTLFDNSTMIIACADAVGINLQKNHKIPNEKLTTIHSFVENEVILQRIEAVEKAKIRQKYNLPTDKCIVVSCGNAEWRKGSDLFIQIANNLKETDIHFVWVGIKHEGELYDMLKYDIIKMGISSKIHLIEPTPEAVEIIKSSDIFALTSREDPFPLVMLEAALAGKPIIGFDDSGGCSEFVEQDAGFVVEYLDTQSFATTIVKVAQNQALLKEIGTQAKQKVLKNYNFVSSISKIEDVLSKFLS